MAAFKAQAMIRTLKEQLRLSVAGASFVEGSDSSFFPILLVSKGAGASAEAILIKIEMLPDDAQHKDALDQPQRLYNPHRIRVLREDEAGTEVPQQRDLREKVTSECIKLGSKVEIWEKEGIRLATAISAYDLTGATKVAEVGADNRKANPLTNSQ